MRHPENLASQRPTQPNELSELMQELKLLKGKQISIVFCIEPIDFLERITILETSVFGSHVPVSHELEQACKCQSSYRD